MKTTIRQIKKSDIPSVLQMMRDFYESDAVLSNGSPEIFERDLNECLGDSPYAEGYVFDHNGKTAGYAIIAKSFSTESGKRCIWIEDLYLLPEARGNGLAKDFLKMIFEKYPDHVFRLEVEKENKPAVSTYLKSGFEFIEYDEMIRLNNVK